MPHVLLKTLRKRRVFLGMRHGSPRRNGTVNGDRAVELEFSTGDAEVSGRTHGSAVVLLEAAFRLAGRVRTPHHQDTRPHGTAQHFDRANSRAWNRGSEDAWQPRVISGGRVAIRSATRYGDRSDSSLSDQRSCQPRTAHQSTAQNRARAQRSGARNRNRWGSGRETWSFRRHRRASGGVITFQGRDGFDYEHEHRRKRLSTSTIGSEWADERNGSDHRAAAVDLPLENAFSAAPVHALVLPRPSIPNGNRCRNHPRKTCESTATAFESCQVLSSRITDPCLNR